MKKMISGFNFEYSYYDLDEKMYSKLESRNIVKPELKLFNDELATDLGLHKEFFDSQEGLELLVGKFDSEFSAYAQAYAGHQFAHFTMLGDGRALNLGEHVTKDNNRYDIQLKGSGRTPYSRRGDGKGTLSSMYREYIVSEAMNNLNIPTTRSLAVVATGEKIVRQNIENGGILTRVAKSHIRFGTFEYVAAYGTKKDVKALADYSINRHYPQLNNKENKYSLFLQEVLDRQASLIAKWISVGFIHGVMNTDNMLVSGETIDYGPCAFMDTYNPKTVFSSIDQNGRYAYINQPYIVTWNIARFAESILSLLDEDSNKALDIANQHLTSFETKYLNKWLQEMGPKCGLFSPVKEDKELIDDFLKILESTKSDYTNSFRLLTEEQDSKLSFYDNEMYKEWYIRWQKRLKKQKESHKEVIALMKQHNPYVIPRNHIVEAVLQDVSINKDKSLLKNFLDVLKNPYDYTRKYDEYYTEPSKSDNTYVTYCGT